MNYSNIDAVNQSSLKHILKSPKHYLAKLDEPTKPPTDAQLIGSLVHCRLLEPEQFGERYAVMPAFHLDAGNVTKNGRESKSKSTAYYEDRVTEWRKSLNGKQEVTQAQMDISRIAANEAQRHLPPAGFLAEETLTAEIHGVLCKGRLDILVRDVPAIYDIKTTDNCAAGPFFSQLHRLHGGFQLAFYRELVRQCYGVQNVACYVIAVEVSGDFDSVLYEIENQHLDESQERVVRALRTLRRCTELDEWPGVDAGAKTPVMLYTPPWAMWSGDQVETYEGDA